MRRFFFSAHQERGAIKGMDHVVVNIARRETLDFWERLGFELISFGAGHDRWALQLKHQKINIHLAGQTILPRARHHGHVGSADLCFEVDRLSSLIKRLEEQGMVIEQGPVARTGARGAFTSVYVRDPEGNLLEFSEYPLRQRVGAYVKQYAPSFFAGVITGACLWGVLRSTAPSARPSAPSS